MENRETLATFDMLDTERRQTRQKHNTTQHTQPKR